MFKKTFPAMLIMAVLSVGAHADDVDRYNRISLQSEAATEVVEDKATVVLEVVKDAASSLKSEREVNTRANRILTLLEEYPAVKVETGHYRTNPIYVSGQRNVIDYWQTRQSINLSSLDLAVLKEVLAKLQVAANIGSMSFSVSREKHEMTIDGLMDEAVNRFNEKAQRLVTLNNGSCFKLVQMSVNEDRSSGGQQYYQRGVEMMSAMSDSVAPAMSAGEKTIKVNVSGEIEMVPAGSASALCAKDA